MPLYQKLLATHFNWQKNEIEVEIDDAVEFIEHNKQSKNINILFETILDSFCLAIYYSLKNPNRADRFFMHTDYFDFASQHTNKIISKLNTIQTASLYQICCELALNYNTIGVGHANKHNPRDYSMGHIYFERVVQLYQLINDEKSLAENLYNQALTLIHLHQYQDAQPLFEQANRLFFKQNEIHLRSRCIYYIGACKFMQKMFKEAWSDFNDALNYYQEPHLLERQGGFLYEQATILKEDEQYFIAKKYFLLASKTYQQVGNNSKKSDCQYQANRCNQLLLLNSYNLSHPTSSELMYESRLRLTVST